MARKTKEKNISWDDQKKCYYVTLYFGTKENGKPDRGYATTTSLKEARQILKEHNRKKAAGIAVPPVKNTLSDVTRDFIAYKATSLAETTIHGYTNIYKNHIQPYFKSKPIQEVNTKDIQDYVAAKAKTLSMNSVKKHIDLLYSVFQNAYNTRIINENPIARMEPFRGQKPKMQCMDASEITKLCQSVSGTNLEIPVLLAAFLGLRRGEIAGLRWQDIDFENAVIHIENTRTKAGGKLVEKTPKTERSNRQLLLPEELSAILQEHKRKQTVILRCHEQTHDYVVTGRGGKPCSPNYISESFHHHILKNGFKPVRFHDLRHSFASIANEAGTKMSDISSAMGHSSIAVTSSIYTHEFAQTKAKAVSAVASMISTPKHQQIAG